MAMFHQSFAGRDLGALLAPYLNRATSAQTDTGVDGVLRVVDRTPNTLTYTDDLNTGYTKRGTCVVTPNAGPMSVGTKKMSLITGLGAIGVNDWYKLLSALGTIETPVGISFRINRNGVMSGTLVLSNAQAIAYGRWDVNLALVPDGEIRITSSHAAVTVVQPFRLHTSGNSGVQLSCAAGLAPFYVGGFQHQVGVTDPNFTEYFHNGDNSRPAFDGADGARLELAQAGLISYTDQIDNAVWLKSRVNVTPNDTISLDGGLNADTVVEDTSTGTHELGRSTSVTLAADTSVVVKALAKRKVGNRNFRITLYTGSSGLRATFDFDALTATNGSYGTSTFTSASIESAAGGWYWVTLVGKVSATEANPSFSAQLIQGASGSTYTGDGVSSVSLWRVNSSPGTVRSSSVPADASLASRAASYIGPVPVVNLGLTSKVNGYSFLIAVKMPSIPSEFPIYASLLSIGASASNRFWLETSSIAGRFSLNKAVNGVSTGAYPIASSWSPGQVVLFKCSIGPLYGLQIHVNSLITVNAAAVDDFGAALTHLALNGLVYSLPNSNAYTYKGLRVWDSEKSPTELTVMTADVFDIPETGLLTRKPTNSLTKLLTRPMAA